MCTSEMLSRPLSVPECKFEVSRLVLSTLNEALAGEPDRKCFRLIGGILVERTVKDVVPALQTNRDGVSLLRILSVSSHRNFFPCQIRKVIASLTEQYKAKEGEFEKFKEEYNIRPAGRI